MHNWNQKRKGDAQTVCARLAAVRTCATNAAARLVTASETFIEPLESRKMLCGLPHSSLPPAPAFDWALERSAGANSGSGDATSIVWSNRGTVGDGFQSTFGANAARARSVVDAVLSDWSRAITDWNRSDSSTTLQVSISMNTGGTGFSANAGPAQTGIPADGKPRTGSMMIGRGNDTTGDGIGDGGSWFLDATPTDSAEFLGDSVNAFTSRPNPAISFDLYTVVNLELTHVLGLVTGPSGSAFNNYKLFTSGYTSILTTADTAEAGSSNTGTRGYYAKFDGPTIEHLMTTNSGGSGGSDWGSPIHTAGGNASVNIGGTIWVGAEDSGNAVYESSRYLPSEVILRMLGDAYGYSIIDPTTLPTMHSVLNTTNGTLFVRGGAIANSSDIITIEQVGTKLRVSVDIGNDVPGTGALPGAGNLPAYVSEYELSTINAIQVYGFDGNDIITVDAMKNTTVFGGAGADTLRVTRSASTAGVGVTLNGEAGNDQLYAGLNNNVEAIDGTTFFDGGIDSDTVWIEDAFNNLITPYLYDSVTLTRTGAGAMGWNGVEGVRLNVTNAGANVTVRSVTIPTTIQGGSGSDTFNVGNLANTLDDTDASVTLEGGSGTTDIVQFNDNGNTTPPVYQVTSNTLTRSGMWPVTFNAMESFILNGTAATDEFQIASTGNNCVYRFFGGANSDRFYLGDGSTDRLEPLDGQIIIDGQGGASDEVKFDDSDESSAQTFFVTETGVTRNGMASVTLTSVEDITIDAGSGGDTFDVTPSGVIEYVVDGNGGTDTLLMRTAGTTAPTHAPSGTSGTWTFGNRKPVNYLAIESVTTPGSNVAPTIASLSASPTSVTVGTASTLTANSVADSDGTIASVSFYRESNGTSGFQTDDLLIISDANSPYTAAFSTTGLAAGSYTLYARAADNGGAFSNVVSTTVTITTASNVAPTISSLSASPTSVVIGGSSLLTANGVTDSDGTILIVYFYRENNGVAGFQTDDFFMPSDSSAPYTATFNSTGFAAGTYTFYSRALDNGNAISNVVTTNITVTTPSNTAPTIISLGASTGSIVAGHTLRLTANGVSDPDGTLFDVRFFRETNGVAGFQLGGDTFITNDLSGTDGWFADVNTLGFSAGTHQFYAMARDNVGLESNVVSVSVNVTTPAGPAPFNKVVLLDQFPIRVLHLWLQDVGASLDTGDLTVRNLATNVTYPVSDVTWDSQGFASIFSLATIPPDGNYRATLNAAGIHANGVQMTTNVDVDFFILRGDANRDRRVNFDDLLILAQNYGGVNKIFSQGNFNFDTQGKVDFDDLLLLAQRYGTTLMMNAPAGGNTRVSTTTKRSVAADVLS